MPNELLRPSLDIGTCYVLKRAGRGNFVREEQLYPLFLVGTLYLQSAPNVWHEICNGQLSRLPSEVASYMIK